MASYIIELSTVSDSLANWKTIPLDDADAAYCMSNGGHVAFDISGFAPSDSMTYDIGIAWADCDTSANNAIIGVSKFQLIEVSSGTVSTGKGGNYVIDFSSPSDRYIETNGLGPTIDLRTPPTANRKRIAFIGLVSDHGSQLPVTLILTPTKIL